MAENQEHQAVDTQEQDQSGTTEEIKDQNQSSEQVKISDENQSVEPVETQDQNQPVETIEPEVVPQSDQPVTTGALEGATATSGGQMSAVVIGCTGAIGRCLVGVLLQDKNKFGKVTLIGRRKVDSVAEVYGVNLEEEERNGRLIQHSQDMDEITDDTIQQLCTGSQVFFCCLGTTRKAAGSAEAFHHIDCDIPVKFARAAKTVGVSHYSIVTSQGAKANSFFLYMRTKGEVEQAIRELEFPYTSIFRPGLLDRGGTTRFLERVSLFILKGMPVGTVAQAMAIDAYSKYTSTDPANNVVIMDNAAIYRTVQQNNPPAGGETTTTTTTDPPAGDTTTDPPEGGETGDTTTTTTDPPEGGETGDTTTTTTDPPEGGETGDTTTTTDPPKGGETGDTTTTTTDPPEGGETGDTTTTTTDPPKGVETGDTTTTTDPPEGVETGDTTTTTTDPPEGGETGDTTTTTTDPPEGGETGDTKTTIDPPEGDGKTTDIPSDVTDTTKTNDSPPEEKVAPEQ